MTRDEIRAKIKELQKRKRRAERQRTFRDGEQNQGAVMAAGVLALEIEQLKRQLREMKPDAPADRETQHGRYIDAGPQAWDDQ